MPRGKIAALEERLRELEGRLNEVYTASHPLQNELAALQERWRKLPQPKTAEEAIALAQERRRLQERAEEIQAKLAEMQPVVRRLAIERDAVGEALREARAAAAEARRLLPKRRAALARAREEYEAAVHAARAKLWQAEEGVEMLEKLLRELEGEDAQDGGDRHERAA